MSPVNGERYSRDGEKAIKRESCPSPCNDVSSRGSAASSSGKHKVVSLLTLFSSQQCCQCDSSLSRNIISVTNTAYRRMMGFQVSVCRVWLCG